MTFTASPRLVRVSESSLIFTALSLHYNSLCSQLLIIRHSENMRWFFVDVMLKFWHIREKFSFDTSQLITFTGQYTVVGPLCF